jgi:PAS domain S-box-containing protein
MHRSERPDLTISSFAEESRDQVILLLDESGRVVGCSEGVEDRFGRRAAEVVGRSWTELLGEGLSGGGSELLERARGSGDAGTEIGLSDRSGRIRDVAVSVSAVRSADRAGPTFAVVIRDLTERRALESALRDVEARFAGIIAISTDAIVSVDESQRIVFFNQGAEQIFGYAADEVLGHPLELLIPGRFRRGHDDEVRGFGGSPVRARRMGERGQIVGLRKDGEEFPAEASISQYSVAGRRVFTAVLRDSTERQRTEEALARQAAELSRSNADLEQFAYVASHDLQEPLRMVASYTQLLARRYGAQLDDDAREFIGFAVDGVTRMQSLINDLLAYSRVGTRGHEFEATDVGALVQRVVGVLRPVIEETGAEVVCDELPTVMADPGQLVQLFQNLLANALKFRRPDTTPRIHFGVRRVDHGWEFSVRDNGIGIDPEYADRIFVIFQRLHSRAEYPGTGIGLAICKKIVERHGGQIRMESSPGNGTTFVFDLPDEAAP